MTDIIINVKVKPKSGKFCIKKDVEKDIYVVNLKSVPENNEANTELIKNLSRLLKKDVFILRGHKSKRKKIMIKDMSVEELNKYI